MIHAILYEDPKPLAGPALHPSPPSSSGSWPEALEKEPGGPGTLQAGEMLADLREYERALSGRSGGRAECRSPFFVGFVGPAVASSNGAYRGRIPGGQCGLVPRNRAEVRWRGKKHFLRSPALLEANDVWRNLVPPYRLAEQAEAILGDDPELAGLCSAVLPGDQRPDRARRSHASYTKEYEDPDCRVVLPRGHPPARGFGSPSAFSAGSWRRKDTRPSLRRLPPGTSGVRKTSSLVTMISELWTRGASQRAWFGWRHGNCPSGPLGDFFIGRYEVTNREYKAFVDAGGYSNRSTGINRLCSDGRELTWEEAHGRSWMSPGRAPAPHLAGWGLSPGQEDHPVSGVSWYEAAAYAEYARNEPPARPLTGTWPGGAFTPRDPVAPARGFRVFSPRIANFGGQGPVPVGSLPGFTAYGAYDMPGNVREWCWNETAQGSVVRGGSLGGQHLRVRV